MPTITPSEHVTRKHLVVDPVVAATSLGVRYPFFFFTLIASCSSQGL